jgi:Flp pilus assembly protein protease CpaA
MTSMLNSIVSPFAMPSLTLPMIDPHAAGCLAAVVVFVAALTDIRSHKIYNLLTYPAMVGGLLLAAISSGFGALGFLSPISAGESLSGLLGCGLLMLIPYHLSRGGAGDVKLAMAMGSLIGFQATLQGFCVGYIFAAAYLIIRSSALVAAHLLAAGGYRLVDGDVPAAISIERPSMSKSIPLAGFFLLGMAAVLWSGPLW